MVYTKETFKKQPSDFRIGLIISDGMWYSLPKWRKMAKVTEQEINTWVDKKLSEGILIQSPTGAKSYRFPLTSIKKWYKENGFIIGEQLIDSIFPARIWDNMTETEGFLNAPLRKIGVVSFSSTVDVAREISLALRGIAKLKEVESGKYKAYSLNAQYTKEIIEKELVKYGYSGKRITYSKSESRRRELVDFSPKFASGLILFYKEFAKSMVKNQMDTIKVFLPDPEDQESQITLWVLTAIEKFDESAAVPFSGYLDSALSHWPYNLPSEYLGQDLSIHQRERSKALRILRNRYGTDKNFTSQELAEAMGITDNRKFNDLEDQHKIWNKTRTATTLTWDENSDEKIAETSLLNNVSSNVNVSDIKLAHKISLSVIESALNTELFEDAFSMISQIDVSELNIRKIQSISDDFIQELGLILGVKGE